MSFLIFLVILMPSFEEHNGPCLTPKLVVKRDVIQTQSIILFSEIVFPSVKSFMLPSESIYKLPV